MDAGIMQTYLSFDQIFEETKFQLGGGVQTEVWEEQLPFCPIVNFAPYSVLKNGKATGCDGVPPELKYG